MFHWMELFIIRLLDCFKKGFTAREAAAAAAAAADTAPSDRELGYPGDNGPLPPYLRPCDLLYHVTSHTYQGGGGRIQK